MNATVRKAVIPAAGHGTRMRPFSALVPKELVPLGSTPALHWILAEAAAAGFDQIGLVVGPHKDLIKRYVAGLDTAGTLPVSKVEWIEQETPLGLAEAIALCRDFVAGEPFALMLPDNLFLAPGHDLGRLASAARSTGLDVVGVLDAGPEESGRFGNCGRLETEPRGDGLLAIQSLADKGPGRLMIAPGERILRACGRYVFQAHVFDAIDRVRPEVTGEFSEVPVFQRLIARAGAIGCLLEGPLFDVGDPNGVLAASAHLHATSHNE